MRGTIVNNIFVRAETTIHSKIAGYKVIVDADGIVTKQSVKNISVGSRI